MNSANRMKEEVDNGLDLGIVICKYCLNVITTLPTEGLTKIYGDCKDPACQEERQRGE